jgi:hypothetical protein
MADFRVGDAQNLPFAGSAFDVAAMALVIALHSDRWPPNLIAVVSNQGRARPTLQSLAVRGRVAASRAFRMTPEPSSTA